MELKLWKNGFFRAMGPKLKKDRGNTPYVNSFNKIELEKIGIYDNEVLYALCLRTEYGFGLLISEYDQLSAKGEELIKAINGYLNTN